MPPETSATAADTVLSAHSQDAIQDQTLSEALRTGDRETVEAIVHKLAGQLESLRTEAVLATQSDDLGTRHADAITGQLLREEEQRRRLSSLPDVAVGAKDSRKRMTMAFGMASPEAVPTGLMCAYCGMSLDSGLTLAKPSLTSDIGYCCSHCESILGDADRSPPDDPEDAREYFDAAPDAPADAQLCGTCKTPLGDEYVNVLGRRFHVTHFVCDDCNIPLYALGGYLQDPSGCRKFYCQRDYLQRFSPACHACSVQITSGEMVVALGRTYHSECFVCSICQSPFVGDVCYEHDSQPLCEWHWYIQNGLLCTECGGIIKNQCVLTRGKKYHQSCAESKYGEQAVTVEEARRQIKAAKSAPQPVAA